MNISLESLPPVIKVCVTNPHTTYARLFLTRLFSGKIYGPQQEISVILLSTMEDPKEMEGLKVQLENCAFPINAGIEVVQDLKKAVKDIHVFVLMTPIESINALQHAKEELPATTVNAILDIKACATTMEYMLHKHVADGDIAMKTSRRPLVVTDCLAALTIFAHYATDYPREKMFCSTCLDTVARFVLVTHLDVLSSQLSHIYVWAADSDSLHVETDEPLISFKEDDDKCTPTLVQRELLEYKNIDRTDFNESWMKSRFLEKTRARANKNPFGPISSAHTLSSLLKDISSLILYGNNNPNDPEETCKKRDRKPQINKINAGILSDGSYGLPTGLPFVFPLIITDDTWEVDNTYRHNLLLKKTMQQLKITAKKNYEKVIALCKAAVQQQQDTVFSIAAKDRFGVPTPSSTADPESRDIRPKSSHEGNGSDTVTEFTDGHS